MLAPRATADLVVPRVPAPGPLRWFWLDGVAASVHDAMTVTFIPLFALALGATAVQIGWLSSLGALAGTLVLLPGARLAERIGQPHRIVLFSSLIARLTILVLALWPLAGLRGVYVVIALATLRTAVNQLAAPAWTAITADIVPADIRGRYLSSRNVAMALGAVIALPLAGRLIQLGDDLAGYRVDFALAAAVGLISTYFYSKIVPPVGTPRSPVTGKRLPLLARLRTRPNFVLFCLHSAVWNLALQVAAPFFNVYLVEELGAGTLMVGVVATTSTVASLVGQKLWGVQADRQGARKIMLVSGGLIPLVPFFWLFVTDPVHAIPLNLFGGFVWAGYNIAAFNFLLDATPSDRRARYVALYSTVVGLANAAGPLIGGWVAAAVSYHTVFGISAAGRMLAVLLLYLTVREPVGADSVPDGSNEGEHAEAGQ